MLDHLVELAPVLHNLYLHHHNGSPYENLDPSPLPDACPSQRMVHHLQAQPQPQNRSNARSLHHRHIRLPWSYHNGSHVDTALEHLEHCDSIQCGRGYNHNVMQNQVPQGYCLHQR